MGTLSSTPAHQHPQVPLEAGQFAPATVFGLDVYAEAPVTLLGSSQATPTGRKLCVHIDRAPSSNRLWHTQGELLCDERKPDGSVNFRIQSDRRGNYLIGGPEYGSHVLSRDGHELRCYPEDGREWQRLLIAQVLPFAALLHGLEVFHASAVVLDGGAVAIAGPSGSGKTSLALELCGLGAHFLADDVLALEVCNGELLCHPGTPVAGVARNAAEHRGADASVLGSNARERLVAMRGAPEPVPLTATFFLDRQRNAPPQPRFEPVTDPQMLLSATFNFVLGTQSRLSGLLEVCALAAQGRVERIHIGPSVDAAQLGEAIARRMSTSL
jgi:hypothetical protein